jgi:hypothetical protein
MSSCSCNADLIEKNVSINHAKSGLLGGNLASPDIIDFIEIVSTCIYICSKCEAFAYRDENGGDLSGDKLSLGNCCCLKMHSTFMYVMSKEAHKDWLCLINDPAALLIDNSYHKMPKWAQENVQLRQPTESQIQLWLARHGLEDLYKWVLEAREKCECKGIPR